MLALAPACAAEAGRDADLAAPIRDADVRADRDADERDRASTSRRGLRACQRLFAGGRKDEAVFWFYTAQLRYPTSIAARPGADPSGAPALFSALMEDVGRPINEYAFGDIPALVATLDRVLAWDEAHAHDFASRDAARAEIVAGLRQMKGDMLARQAEIRVTRANGFPNRN